MNTEQQRAEFEAWAVGKWPGVSFAPDQNNCGIVVPERYKHPKLQVAWEAWRDGRAALQSPIEFIAAQWDGCIYQAADGSDIDIGHAIRCAAERLGALQSQDREDAARIDWMAKEQCAIQKITMPSGDRYRLFWSGGQNTDDEFQSEFFASPQEAIDHARRIDGGTL